MIDFHQLIGSGGKEGARETFERLITQLVGLRHPGVRRVKANPGDWGLDVFVGEIDGVVSVWQAKFFIDGIGEAQKAQIRDSFESILKKSAERDFEIDAWTLCVPDELDAPAHQWWTKWKREKEKATGIRITLWDRADLEAFVLTRDAASIRSAYFPQVPGPQPLPPPVLDPPEGIEYDEMLFIKQLQAAAISELESAKQQFFNAEALGREVGDKRIPEQMEALAGERADLLSVWEDRYNRACIERDEDARLTGLHGDVMEAIEQRHNSSRVEPLPMHLVHRKGVMHQVVDAGNAGWIRDFREIVRQHRGEDT